MVFYGIHVNWWVYQKTHPVILVGQMQNRVPIVIWCRSVLDSPPSWLSELKICLEMFLVVLDWTVQQVVLHTRCLALVWPLGDGVGLFPKSVSQTTVAVFCRSFYSEYFYYWILWLERTDIRWRLRIWSVWAWKESFWCVKIPIMAHDLSQNDDSRQCAIRNVFDVPLGLLSRGIGNNW